MKKTREELEKLAQKYLADGEQEAWEKGELGKDTKHMKVVSQEKTKRFIEEKNNYATSIRLPHELIVNLKVLAKKNGLNYQTYLKMILTRHVNDSLEKSA